MSGEKRVDIDGQIERIVYQDASSGWTVLRLASKGQGLITAVGRLQVLSPGEQVKLTGEWVVDAKHGRQFRAETCLPLSPATLEGIEKFLGSGMIPGIGEVMAGRLVKRFGMETLDVIEHHPRRLAEVPGIGEKRASAISQAMVSKRHVREVMVFLESAGVSPAFSHRIYQRFGKDAIRKVSDNPYCLASEVQGIGFLSADKIAAHLGVSKESPYRAEAGLLYALETLASDGHVFARKEELIPQGMNLLDLDEAMLLSALDRLVLMGHLRRETADHQDACYLPRLFRAETLAASDFQNLLNTSVGVVPIQAEKAIAKAERISGLKLADEQAQAFFALQHAKVLLLTGGPGTGKTTLLRGLVACLIEQKLSVSLAAPTGRAARRMAQSVGQQAATLHRLLEFAPRTKQFDRNREHPLEADVLVVDEMSMVDMELFAALVAACKPSARLILVGDPDQLPSVGAGAVLFDLLALPAKTSSRFAVVRLQQIFRQSRQSLIITGAHDILAGYPPKVGHKGDDADLFLIERNEPEEILETIKELVGTRIPERFGFNPIDDIQVLTPMHKGVIGTGNLNTELQALLNPAPGGLPFRHSHFKTNDKVMQIRNNYDMEVFNGDVGKVVIVDPEGQWLDVQYPEKKVRYPATELEQIILAYACSVHKSQGSEYPAVIIPLHTQHYVMLQRNLLYTALTRGKKLVVIVGSAKALNIAVRNDTRAVRNTAFGWRITQDPGPQKQ